jgi:hypothetical protein
VEPLSIELEKVGQERFTLLAMRPTMLVVISPIPLALVTMMIGVWTPRIAIVGTRRRRPDTGSVGTRYITGIDRALDDLVKLTAIKPHAATLRAIVDLDAQAVGHDKIDGTHGTLHRNRSLLAGD